MKINRNEVGYAGRVIGISIIGDELLQEYNFGNTNEGVQNSFEIKNGYQFFGFEGSWPDEGSGLANFRYTVSIKNDCLS